MLACIYYFSDEFNYFRLLYKSFIIILMKTFKIIKIISLIILFFYTSLVESQSLFDLKKLNDSLKYQKELFLNEISELDRKIEIINDKILIQNLKENSIKTLIKRNCNFYDKANELTAIIENPEANTDIHLIEYYAYGTYIKAIYNDKIGYIKENDIRSNSESKKLKSNITSNSSYKSNLSSSTNKQYGNSKKTISRTYYRGSRGGCYYINSNGNKTYVARSMCN